VELGEVLLVQTLPEEVVNLDEGQVVAVGNAALAVPGGVPPTSPPELDALVC
jgi:hypothetical protein